MPYQLNIVGSLSTSGSASISGPLNIAGGITPIYTTPSFGPGQVGYVYENNTFTSTASNATWAVMVSQAVPAGIYVATGSYSLLYTQNSFCYIAIGSASGDSSEYQNSVNQSNVRLSISGIFTGPCTIFLSYNVTGTGNPAIDTGHNRFKVVRIA